MDHIDALRAVRSIYARLQVEIDRRKPICVASGKCCNFESYGTSALCDHAGTRDVRAGFEKLHCDTGPRPVRRDFETTVTENSNPNPHGPEARVTMRFPAIGPGCPLAS